MWGTPGTLVAARQMLELTGDERWRDAWQAGADALWSRRDDEGYWTQRLYGEEYRGLGTAHGLVGNVQALRPLLDAERRGQLERETNALLARSAFVEDGLANWAYIERPQLASAAGEIRLQWCAGAPGIVVAAADYLDEELLLAGAELVWRAGPPTQEKGAGICHGTAGNGYALLAAFERTGDEEWLEPGAALRRPCARPGRAGRGALLALDRRRRRRGLRRRLPRGPDALPRSRLNPGLARERERLAVRRRAGRCRRRACGRPRRAATRSRRSARPPSGSRTDLGRHPAEHDLAAAGPADRVGAGAVDRGPDDLGRDLAARSTARRGGRSPRPEPGLMQRPSSGRTPQEKHSEKFSPAKRTWPGRGLLGLGERHRPGHARRRGAPGRASATSASPSSRSTRPSSSATVSGRSSGGGRRSVTSAGPSTNAASRPAV